MTPRRWALLAWGVFLVALIGTAAAAGGRKCEIPKSGPFHWLLQGHQYVETHSKSWRVPACVRVK
jgi:hypothetical protein